VTLSNRCRIIFALFSCLRLQSILLLELDVRFNAEIAISPLPDRAQVEAWLEEDFSAWTSVCGVGVDDIASVETIDHFPGQVFRLSDPFSKSEPCGSDFVPSSRLFLEQSDALLRSVLLKAVRHVVENYLSEEKQVVFCHMGKSRSPLVAVSALYVVHSYDPRALWAHYVENFNADPATELGMAALCWVKENCRINP
jgi:hypothetical protein